ncbi:hypothetical protein VNO78_17962 [Psophocarpus tetragonolobus]|uniref:Endonuclease/exonuclease/phosphatase domain-containing protein n=1 Tax=Psophocarpus tetragonolobus TaxID=3891 RepID=A0AAN9SNJ7_PSOTE
MVERAFGSCTQVTLANAAMAEGSKAAHDEGPTVQPTHVNPSTVNAPNHGIENSAKSREERLHENWLVVSGSGNHGKESTVTPTLNGAKSLQRKKRKRTDPIVMYPKRAGEDTYEKIPRNTNTPKSQLVQQTETSKVEQVSRMINKDEAGPFISERPSSSKARVNLSHLQMITTPHVEMFAPNHLRSMEEPKPPDLLSDNIDICETQHTQKAAIAGNVRGVANCRSQRHIKALLQRVKPALILDSRPQAISILVSSGSNCWICTTIYASAIPNVRMQLWRHLKELHTAFQCPWVIIGDFNDILLASEQHADIFNHSRAEAFASVLDDCSLMDLGFFGCNFTWQRPGPRGRFINAWGPGPRMDNVPLPLHHVQLDLQFNKERTCLFGVRPCRDSIQLAMDRLGLLINEDQIVVNTDGSLIDGRAGFGKLT